MIADVRRSPITLAAWGSRCGLLGQGCGVARLPNRALGLGSTVSGVPRHPLYVGSHVEVVAYRLGGSTMSG